MNLSRQYQTSLKITVLVPYTSNPGFVDRSDILEKLKKYLGRSLQPNGGTSQARAALFGLGGIGYARS